MHAIREEMGQEMKKVREDMGLILEQLKNNSQNNLNTTEMAK